MLQFFDGCSALECIEGLQSKHETPMMWRERKRAEMQAEAIVCIEADPHVQEMLACFDGVLIKESISAVVSQS